jgi:hypothetical protein
MNHYISIDLNRLYNNQINELLNDDKSSLNSINFKKSQIELHELVNQYNSIETYNFTNNDTNELNNPNTYINDIIYKYNLDSSTESTESNDKKNLILLNKFNLINSFYKNPSIIKQYNSGLILFDNSMVSDNELYKIINLVFTNYDKTIIDKIYDNYFLYFHNKLSDTDTDTDTYTDTDTHININILNYKLNQLFIDDLNHMLLWSKIKNIPFLLNNSKLNKKISFELSYTDQIKEEIYQNHYKQIKKNKNEKLYLSNYEKILKNDLSDESTNYIVNYQLNLNSNFEYTISDHLNSLNKLKEYNSFLDEIKHSININPSSEISNYRLTESGQHKHFDNTKPSDKLIKVININDLFNMNKINDLYSFIINNVSNDSVNLQFKMSDVFDNKISIYENLENQIMSDNNKIQTNQTNQNIKIFNDQLIMFINKLLKKKITKTIRYYNYIQNKINIDNNI